MPRPSRSRPPPSPPSDPMQAVEKIGNMIDSVTQAAEEIILKLEAGNVHGDAPRSVVPLARNTRPIQTGLTPSVSSAPRVASPPRALTQVPSNQRCSETSVTTSDFNSVTTSTPSRTHRRTPHQKRRERLVNPHRSISRAQKELTLKTDSPEQQKKSARDRPAAVDVVENTLNNRRTKEKLEEEQRVREMEQKEAERVREAMEKEKKKKEKKEKKKREKEQKEKEEAGQKKREEEERAKKEAEERDKHEKMMRASKEQIEKDQREVDKDKKELEKEKKEMEREKRRLEKERKKWEQREQEENEKERKSKEKEERASREKMEKEQQKAVEEQKAKEQREKEQMRKDVEKEKAIANILVSAEPPPSRELAKDTDSSVSSYSQASHLGSTWEVLKKHDRSNQSSVIESSRISDARGVNFYMPGVDPMSTTTEESNISLKSSRSQQRCPARLVDRVFRATDNSAILVLREYQSSGERRGLPNIDNMIPCLLSSTTSNSTVTTDTSLNSRPPTVSSDQTSMRTTSNSTITSTTRTASSVRTSDYDLEPHVLTDPRLLSPMMKRVPPKPRSPPAMARTQPSTPKTSSSARLAPPTHAPPTSNMTLECKTVVRTNGKDHCLHIAADGTAAKFSRVRVNGKSFLI